MESQLILKNTLKKLTQGGSPTSNVDPKLAIKNLIGGGTPVVLAQQSTEDTQLEEQIALLMTDLNVLLKENSEKQRRIQDLAIAAHKCERLENILMETETKKKRLIELERAYEQKMAKMDEVEEEVGQLEHHIEDLRNQTKVPAAGEEGEATMNRTSSSSKTRELLVLFIKCVLLFLFVAFTAEWLVRRHEVLRDYLLPPSTGPFRPT